MKALQQEMTMLFQLQAATNKARATTGDKHIATQVARGRYTVTVLRGGLTPAQAVAHLEAMQ